MSVDRSLRIKNSLERHRNVLTRAERVTSLLDQDRWSDDTSALGLPKIPHRKGKAGKKKAEVEAQAATTEAVEETKEQARP